MRLNADWIARAETRSVCDALTGAGYRALFVGGCVRNTIIGAPVADIDISTDARPETVTNLAKSAGLRVVPTGFDHGTVTVVAGGIAHEVTTFRRDVETDGRRAVVAFSEDIALDAARRDFTMNALYADPDGIVIDPLGGLPDLLSRTVRFVGDAQARITEDYLRILRFFRFHAWYGDPAGGIDPEGLAACAANIDGLVTLSRERVGAEMRKLLSADDPAPSLAAMEATGVLSHILPGATVRPLTVLIHLEADIAPDWLRRLAVMGGDAGFDSLRLSRVESRKLAQIKDEIGSMRSLAEIAWRHGAGISCDVALARGAVFEAQLPSDWKAQIDQGVAAVFPVAAADLMPGLQGPALGDRLRVLEARWISSGFALTKAQLLG
ncbi:MAG: CCA tRNA nucleotidyltransferase [Gemmobacter sp.]|nr:CCA tRNA nucleotidyltransferase [Gemmobacter sp.]